MNRWFPPRELVERDDEAAERHREVARERPRPIRGHARVAHLGMGVPDVLDEREQHQQLPGCEQLVVGAHPVVRQLVTELPLKCFTGAFTVEFPLEKTQSFFDPCLRRRRMYGRTQIQLRRFSFDDYGGEGFLHPSRNRHFLDVIGRRRRVARNADRLPRAGLFLVPGNVAGGGARTDAPAEPVIVVDSGQGDHDSALFAQPSLTDERHRSGAAGTAAGNRAHPDAGHRIRTPGARRIVTAPEELGLPRDVLGRRNLNGRVQIADVLPHAFEHDAAPAREVARKGGPEPLGIHERAQLDQMRHRVVVERVALAAEARRFERNRAPAGEQVQHLRRAPAVRLPDAIAGLPDGPRIGLERGKPLDERRGVRAFAAGVRRRNQRGVDRGARRGRRPPSRPVVDERHRVFRMLLLLGRDGVEVGQRQVVLDQPAVVHGHHFSHIRSDSGNILSISLFENVNSSFS